MNIMCQLDCIETHYLNKLIEVNKKRGTDLPKKLKEELRELTVANLFYKNALQNNESLELKIKLREEMTKEVADVYIVLNQLSITIESIGLNRDLVLIYKKMLKEEATKCIILEKLTRTLDRLGVGYYD